MWLACMRSSYLVDALLGPVERWLNRLLKVLLEVRVGREAHPVSLAALSPAVVVTARIPQLSEHLRTRCRGEGTWGGLLCVVTAGGPTSADVPLADAKADADGSSGEDTERPQDRLPVSFCGRVWEHAVSLSTDDVRAAS